jgi:cell division protein FtsN
MSERDEGGGRGGGGLPRDEYYYEIQLTNKQLVFYFLAGATGLILSFLAGIMVGRGVDAGANEPRTVREEPVVAVADDASRKAVPSPSPEALSYPQLESEKANDRLEPTPGQAPAAGVRSAAPAAKSSPTPAPAMKPSPATAGKTPPPPAAPPKAAPTPVKVAAAATPTPVPTAAPTPVPPKPTPTPKPMATPAPKTTPTPKPARATVPAAEAGALSIQVGAFKDKATADGISAQLRRKGYPAHVISPEGGGLFNVRVGPYANHGEAERIKTRLEQQEKFKPFIVKQ